MRPLLPVKALSISCPSPWCFLCALTLPDPTEQCRGNKVGCMWDQREQPLGPRAHQWEGCEFWRRQFESGGNPATELTPQNHTFAKLQQFYEGNYSFMQLWSLSNASSLNLHVPALRTGFGCPGFFRLQPTGDTWHAQIMAEQKSFLKVWCSCTV